MSGCHVCYIGSGLVELGVYTVENYRGMGYASVTTCASYSLAKKLGCIEQADVPSHNWVEASCSNE